MRREARGFLASAAVVALFGSGYGGAIGVGSVAVFLLAALGAWWWREPRPRMPALEDPIPPEPADASSSGLAPLPLESPPRPQRDRLDEVWRLALDACVDGMVITGPDNRVHYANPAMARILATTPTELLGLDIQAILPRLDDEEVSTANYRRTQGDVLGMAWRTEAVRPGGARFAAEVTLNPLGEDGMAVYQIRDVDEGEADGP